MMSSAPANWYPDPHDPSQVRYWDGRHWTEHRAPNPARGSEPASAAPTAPAAEAPKPAAPAVQGSVLMPQAQHAAQPVVASGRRAAGEQPEGQRGMAKVGFFGARAAAQEAAGEVERLRAELDRLGGLDVAQMSAVRARLHQEITELRDQMAQERAQLERELVDLRHRVVITREEEVLQEVGVYEYHHPLADSVAYREELARLKDQIKLMVQRDGGAIEATTSWSVNGSATEGRKMVRDFSKLMLRAYNAEADNLVRGLKPYKVASAKDRLEKVAYAIERLGKTMSIRIAPAYHRLRIRELELTGDYQEMLAREKEQERAEKERLREERKVQQEIQRERERLDKERQHYLNALTTLEAKGDLEAAERMRAELGSIERAIQDVDYRAANVKAGYVYVISNLGAFGDGMIKIGMTRRLEPMDRIRELGDASVPFAFDIHALFFSDDAVGIEAQMHQRLADKRVNRVNLRREFFYATPAEARDHLKQLTGELLQFQELPEAVEFHQSHR